MKNHRNTSIGDAAEACRKSGLEGWQAVEFARKLVNDRMRYSYSNSFDFPAAAFKKGRGYCWHQSASLNAILKKLGFDSRLVYAAQNRFPDKMVDGVRIKSFVSGHVWCRVKWGDEEKDVCSGNADNRPGMLHFQPISPVREWNAAVSFFSYLGSAAVNARRRKEWENLKKISAREGNPENCPCKKKNCPRYKKCEECRAHHSGKSRPPTCERK